MQFDSAKSKYPIIFYLCILEDNEFLKFVENKITSLHLVDYSPLFTKNSFFTNLNPNPNLNPIN